MKLVKILSDKVQIRSDYKEFDDVRINDLIAVSDGEVELVTMVNTLTDIDTENEEEIGENDYILEHSSTKMLECSIIGTVKDGTFQKAIDKYPTMKVSAHRISKEEFASMLSRYTEGFCIGEYSAYEFPAYVDGNKFFQRHACIVGNTGAGKSETVAKILEQTSKLPGANVIVFDIHGEYKELSYARNIQIGGDRPFPIWMFGFTDMISNILKIKEESATVAMTALRKCYYNVCPKGKENRPVYFNYVEFVKLMKFLDEEMVGTGEVYKTGAQAGKEKIVKGDYNGKLTNIVNLLVDKARDSKYQFLFEDMPQQYLYDFMKDVLNNDVPVKNIDLSEVPHDVAIPIIGVITKLVYEIQRTYKSKDVNPVTLVCDEAHVWVINNKLLNCYRFQYVEAYFLAPDISNPDDMYKLLNVTNNAGGITPNMAKEVICDALGRTCEPYTDEWGDVPLTIWKDKAAQTDISGLMGQLTKQIEKAQGKNEPDQVVAVMKEVKKLLSKIQKQEENHAA